MSIRKPGGTKYEHFSNSSFRGAIPLTRVMPSKQLFHNAINLLSFYKYILNPAMKKDFILHSLNKSYWNSSFCAEWKTELSIPAFPDGYPWGEIASQMN